MSDSKRVLSCLPKVTLLELSQAFGFKGWHVLNKGEIIDRLVGDRSIPLEDLLTTLKAPSLKTICQDLGIDFRGSKGDLVGRILSEGEERTMNITMVQVTAAILMHNGKLLIARRPQGDRLEHKWEFPGGKIKANETPEICLSREMKEEFDIEVEVGEYLGSSSYDYPNISIELLAYRTVLVSGSITMNAHDEYRWVSLHDLDQYDFAPADIPFVNMLSAGSIKF